MAINSVLTPYPIFVDNAGLALENGFVYIGQPGFEARSTPKASFFDVGQTIPTGTASGAAIRTKAGLPVNGSGSPAMFYVDGDFSISVCDRNGVLLYSALNTTLALNVGGAVLPVYAADGNLSAVGIGFAGETNTGFVRPSANTLQTVVGGVIVAQQTQAGTIFNLPIGGAGVGALASKSTVAFSDIAPAAVITSTETIAANNNDTSIPTSAGVDAHIPAKLNASGSAPIYAIRAWVNFTGATGVIRASGNVASVTRVGVGDYTVTFTTPLPDANYGIVTSYSFNNTVTSGGNNGSASGHPINASSAKIFISDGSIQDAQTVCVAFVR